MDVFYEESAVNANSEKGERRYRVIHIISMVALVVSIILLVFGVLSFPISLAPDATEEGKQMFEAGRFMAGFVIVQGLLFLLFWFILSMVKKRINVSYDYIFVSGELRITKVFNINKRKGIDRISCDEMLQIGDLDNPSYARLASAPNTKTVYCTSNDKPATGKFFMYILVGGDMKTLYVLECREMLLMQILKFARRSVLESDYVMQEKKQKKTTV